MIRMLFAVDDSAESRQAIEVFLQRIDWYAEKPEIHLLNVQSPLRGDITSFLKANLIEQYHLDEGLKAIAPARDRLEAVGLSPKVHVVVGNAAESIVQYAKEHGCQQILMGSRGLGSAGGWMLGSTATRVLHQSNVPVLILR
jgi:nucleotide-binding universal stress UspA family protein